MGSGGILTSDHVNYMVYRYLQEAGKWIAKASVR
jgi:hypothetical protein